MLCNVARQITPPKCDADWESSQWKKLPSERLQNYMGKRPEHFPKAEVKLSYDEMAIYVIFRVADRYVRAVASEHQGNVWEDSCVEFFFTPDSDLSRGYFNLEMNCGGTMLFHFQSGDGNQRVVIPKNECNKIRCAHSLPQIVDPEIDQPVTWSVEYQIPIALLKRYCQVSTPAQHVKWRANFYKCADRSSHPHWLTWSPVDFPKPNFHLPGSFGTLNFE